MFFDGVRFSLFGLIKEEDFRLINGIVLFLYLINGWFCIIVIVVDSNLVMII